MAEFTFQHPEQIVDALRRRASEVEVEIAALHRKREETHEQLNTALEYLRLWKQMNGIPQDDGDLNALPPPPAVKIRKAPGYRNPERGKVAAAAVVLIEAAGRPLSRQELYDQLTAIGFDIRGKDPQMVLSTMLWRESEQIVRLPNHGYWPKEKPYDVAGYNPQFEDVLGVASLDPEGGEIDDGDDDVIPSVLEHDL